MEETNQDLPEVLETTGTDAAAVETTEEVLTPEQVADLKAKAAKADELEQKNKQLFERAKKAEEAKKTDTAAPSQDGLAPKDYLALTEHKVSSEDFDEVVRVSKILDKPINEALKDKTLQSILKERAEERKTAVATQTRSSRTTTTASHSAVLDQARSGKLPDSDEAIARLVEAEMAGK